MDEVPIDLIVEAGEERQLPARLHQFSSIHIKRGGSVIIVPGGSRWSIWWATGDIIIDGLVIGKGFGRSRDPISDRTPDGKVVSHQFENSAVGGDGGSGGSSTVPGAGASEGGNGAIGQIDYGGGGGSTGGIHIMGSSTRLGTAGQSATDWRGAAPATDGGNGKRGGNGGKLGRHPNGALLFLYTPEKFSGRGEFWFAGEEGEAGSRGDTGALSNRGERGGGGGGGGAPGGDGGRLVIVAGELAHITRLHAPGGNGGSGGQPGNPPRGATPGTDGENGHTGYRDEYSLSDWQMT